MAEYVDVKSRGRDHRRSKQKFSNSRGRGKGLESRAPEHTLQAVKGKKTSTNRRQTAARSWPDAEQVWEGSRATSDSVVSFDGAAESQFEFAVRMDRGVDIELLLGQQSSASAVALKGPTTTKHAQGELNCFALATAMASMPAAERLKMDRGLFASANELHLANGDVEINHFSSMSIAPMPLQSTQVARVASTNGKPTKFDNIDIADEALDEFLESL
eukprot:SAG31_NODE_101_length_25195_cov_67.436758_20_plen_217_part_00